MKPIDLLIYDLDGTLIDSVQDIVSAVNFMLGELKLPARSQEEIRSFIGDGIQNLVDRAIGRENLSMRARALKVVKARYSEHLLDHTKLYPGVPEVLKHFRAKKQVVVTNKPEKFSVTILEGFEIGKLFGRVIGGDTIRTKKPSPEAVFQILNEFGVMPERAVIIGDSAIDIETGKNAKITTCAVTYGLGDQEALRQSKPDFVIGRIGELVKLFC